MPDTKPPPRRGFTAALGVRTAKFLPCKPAFIKRGRSRGKFAVGMRYEREAKEWLSLFALGRPEFVVRDGPWIEFTDESGRRWCQPDALLADPVAQHCLILEVKYQHTSDAWYQLKQLYLPVLRCAMPGYSFSLLEVVHWFDPLTVWPEEIALVRSLDQRPPENRVGTLIFNKRRERRVLAAGHSSGEGAGEAARPIWPAEGPE